MIFHCGGIMDCVFIAKELRAYKVKSGATEKVVAVARGAEVFKIFVNLLIAGLLLTTSMVLQVRAISVDIFSNKMLNEFSHCFLLFRLNLQENKLCPMPNLFRRMSSLPVNPQISNYILHLLCQGCMRQGT